MSEKFPIFISWSGQRSQAMARALKELVSATLQSTAPWLSKEIESGARWSPEIAGALARSTHGIFCVTRENYTAPWLLFEAGAIANAGGMGEADTGRVCVVLEPGMEPTDLLSSPLTQFQARRSTEEELSTLLADINRKLDGRGVPEDILRRIASKFVPDCIEALSNLPDPPAEDVPGPSIDERLLDLTKTVRQLATGQGALLHRLEWLAGDKPIDRLAEEVDRMRLSRNALLHGVASAEVRRAFSRDKEGWRAFEDSMRRLRTQMGMPPDPDDEPDDD